MMRGSGWSAECVKCVGSKFTCDEHYALAAAPGTAKTLQAAECEASQSGGEAVTPDKRGGTKAA